MNLDPPDPEDTREPSRDDAAAERAETASPDRPDKLGGEADTTSGRCESAHAAAGAPSGVAAGREPSVRRTTAGDRAGDGITHRELGARSPSGARRSGDLSPAEAWADRGEAEEPDIDTGHNRTDTTAAGRRDSVRGRRPGRWTSSAAGQVDSADGPADGPADSVGATADSGETSVGPVAGATEPVAETADPGEATADVGEGVVGAGETAGGSIAGVTALAAAGPDEARADVGEGAVGAREMAAGSVAGAAGKRAADRRGERAGPPRSVTVAAVGALVVALAATLWFGAGWVRAGFFTDGPRAAARDAALDAAQQAAINMTSMNIDDVAGSLAIARSSMTGPILASATEHQQQAEAMAEQAGVRMESSVLGAALTSLNSELDRASALVVLRVTEAAPGEQPSGYRYTWSLDMAKDGDIWKAEQVSSLGQPVPLNDAGTDPAASAAPGQPASPNDPAPGPAAGTPGDAPTPPESPDAPAQDGPGNAPPAGETP